MQINVWLLFKSIEKKEGYIYIILYLDLFFYVTYVIKFVILGIQWGRNQYMFLKAYLISNINVIIIFNLLMIYNLYYYNY